MGGIICESGNGSRQEAGKTYPTNHPRSASIEGSDFEEGGGNRGEGKG